MDKDALAIELAKKMYARDKASQALGIEVSVVAAGAATATMAVRDEMVNGFDICHGGIVCALGDTAFAFACNAYGMQTVASSVNADFIRPAKLGDTLTAAATEDYRGRKRGFYSIAIRNQRDELVCMFRGCSVETGQPLA